MLSGLILSTVCILMFFQIPCRLSAVSYPVKGIDVSHYQGNIDWDMIKDQGISVGAYHFFSFDSQGETQAGHFIDTIGPQDGMLIPAVDVEYYGDKKKNPPKEQEVRRELSVMLNILEEHYGCKPLIYSTQSFYHKYLEGYYDEYPLWIRNVYLPPAQDWVIWQYSDKLRLDGVNGDEQYVDGDDPDVIRACLDEMEYAQTREIDFRSVMV